MTIDRINSEEDYEKASQRIEELKLLKDDPEAEKELMRLSTMLYVYGYGKPQKTSYKEMVFLFLSIIFLLSGLVAGVLMYLAYRKSGELEFFLALILWILLMALLVPISVTFFILFMVFFKRKQRERYYFGP
ncbi:MAG: hypothetical protein GY754_03915 [bacterium]|nr:hypothetical protein [bacterium]